MICLPIYTQEFFDKVVFIFSVAAAIPVIPQVVAAIRADKEKAKAISITMFGFFSIYMVILTFVYLQTNQVALFYSAICIFLEELTICIVVIMKRLRKN